MANQDSKRRDRDERAQERLAEAAHIIRAALRDWVQSEVFDALQRCEADVPVLHGEAGERYQKQVQRLNDINSREVDEAASYAEGYIDDVMTDMYEHPLDASLHLREGLWWLEDLVRLLIKAREMVDSYHPGDTDRDRS